jgi:hypothetical protein
MFIVWYEGNIMSMLKEILGIPNEKQSYESVDFVIYLWCIVALYILISIW